ncbi:MAG: glycogen synthase [Gammaproteobacteria bacterium]|nr:glycogen synthase [Gammaproteobacteria bacterium]
MTSFKICFASSELAPFAKTGGLADISAALGRYLHDAGHEVRVFLPLYSSIDHSTLELRPVDAVRDVPLTLGGREFRFSIYRAEIGGPAVHFVHCPALYNRPGLYTTGGDEHLRFILLSRAIIESCQRMAWAPQIFHCNDWHTALIPLYLRTIYGWDRLFADSRTLLTVHNVGYQGIFAASILSDTGLGDSAHLLHQDDLAAGRINFLKTGLLYADALTTVSPTHAEEIQTDAYGMGLQDILRARSSSLAGILNGVDYAEWDPRTDRHLRYHYSPGNLAGKEKNKQVLLQSLGLPYDRQTPVVGLISRLMLQKGIDLLVQVLPELLGQRDLRFVALGSGEPDYEGFLGALQRRYPRQACFYRGFHTPLAHLIEAGSDLFLMPSLYEPCGLNQMYSLRYGTVPIVRRTGGLADTVEMFEPRTGTGTGIVFEDYDAAALRWALNVALDLFNDRRRWRRLQRNGMAQDFSWQRQGARYLEVYRKLCGVRAEVGMAEV